jgi:hypothetical protein
MKLPLPNSSFNFLLGLTILVICGFYTSTTTAHPLSTLLNTITSSASFGLRATNIEESDELSTVYRAVAKRDLSFSFNTMHEAVVVIIVALVVGFVIWCKCAGRKNSQAKDMGDEDSKGGMGGMCVMM